MSRVVPFASLPYPLRDPEQKSDDDNDEDGHHRPWLLISQGNNLQTHTFFDISRNKSLKMKIPEFRNKKIIPASYGWVALIDVRSDSKPLHCCLLNIASKDQIQLPTIEPGHGDHHLYQCILSKPPSHLHCHVLIINYWNKLLYYCRLGDDKFVQRPSIFEDEDNENQEESWIGTNLNGKIYAWMSRSRNFVQVDFEGEELILKKVVNSEEGQPCHIPDPILRDFLYNFGEYLVEYSPGELLLVHAYFQDLVSYRTRFTLFKVDVGNGEFVEMRNIGDRAIILDFDGGRSWICDTADPKSGLKKNSLYYYREEGFMCVYDIEDRSKTYVKLPWNCMTSWIIM